MKPAVLGLVVLLACSTSSSAGAVAEVYCKDGQLRAPLLLREFQAGAAGVSGYEIKIEVDGKWTQTQLAGKKATLKMKGTLSKENAELLAKDLARYDLLSLKSSGRLTVNAHVVAFDFGRLNGTLILLPGQPLPKPEAGSGAALAERYSGVVKAIQDIIKKR